MNDEAGVGRRGVLFGAAAVLAGGVGLFELVDQGVLPGQHRLHALLGEDGPAGNIPDVATGSIDRGTTQGVPWALCHPRRSAGSPRLVVALGGRDASIDDALDTIGLARFLAASGANLALLIVDGGSSYYHRRRDGSDVSAVVADQLVPMAHQRGIDTGRLAFYGWSMGGYGALLMATERRRRGLPVAAVAASSAALWRNPGDSAAGAFDDAADFERNDVFQRISDLRGIPLRIDCGLDDPFYDSDKR
ncbi:MAG: alpha/beta hydrolase-fold protein, partial [Marmoricola sp.]